jgi:hypothetical protein
VRVACQKTFVKKRRSFFSWYRIVLSCSFLYFFFLETREYIYILRCASYQSWEHQLSHVHPSLGLREAGEIPVGTHLPPPRFHKIIITGTTVQVPVCLGVSRSFIPEKERTRDSFGTSRDPRLSCQVNVQKKSRAVVFLDIRKSTGPKYAPRQKFS